MHRLLQDIKTVYAAYKEVNPNADANRLQQAEKILSQVAANPSAEGYLLKKLDTVIVPVLGFEQSSYGSYNDCSPYSGGHEHDFPGSLSHRIRMICCAAREKEEAFIGDWGFILAVYPNYIVTCLKEGYSSDGEDEYWKIDYTYDDSTGNVEFGDRVPVEVMTVVLPAGHPASSESYESEEMEDTQDGFRNTSGKPLPITGKASGLEAEGEEQVKRGSDELMKSTDTFTNTIKGTKSPKDPNTEPSSRSTELFREKGIAHQEDELAGDTKSTATDQGEDGDNSGEYGAPVKNKKPTKRAQDKKTDDAMAAKGGLNPAAYAQEDTAEDDADAKEDNKDAKGKKSKKNTLKGAKGGNPDSDDDEEDEDDDQSAKTDSNEIDQAQNFKTENGQKFSKSAYLIVGDAGTPSTWKVRVEETPGNVTVPQLGRAYAALFKNFRGNAVQAAPEKITAAKRKLKSLYKSNNAPFPGDKKQDTQSSEYPEWLLQGDVPPGGDLELTQTISVVLQQEGEVEADGVMHVSGVATSGDVLNSKNQVYPMEVWQDNLPHLQEMVENGRLLGESDHPATGRPSLDRTTMKYTAVWQDGDQIRFQADILPTEPSGKNMQILVKNGVPVDISSRGRGATQKGTWRGVQNVEVVQRGFRCDAFDAVVAGASPNSTITDWAMAQSSETDQEDITMGEGTQILEELQRLRQEMAEMKGKSATEANATEQTQAGSAANDAAVGQATNGQQMTYTNEATNYLVQQAIQLRMEEACRERTMQWPAQWVNVLRKQLQEANPKTLAEANTLIEARVALVQEFFDQSPKFPGVGFQVQKDKGLRGPQTPNDIIDLLVSDLPDDSPYDPMSFMKQDAEGNEVQIRDCIRTPRRQAKKWLQNIATHVDQSWNGPAAMTTLMRLEQGFDPMRDRDAFLTQTISPDGTTAVGASGAPTSAIYIFPLVRRVFPQLIATELASVQPMDRPEGKIFYLDAYRINGSLSETDEGGNVSSSRIRIDRSDSFDDTYADDPGETQTAALLQLHLSSKSVTAQTKKLYANWTIEEFQDLRAYHGLDVAAELVGALSRQIALEWNQIVLAEMLSGATAGNSIYGTVAPAGFTAKEWEEYLPRYLDLASTNIFKKRHGDMTHIVAGPTAWLRLAAAFRAGTKPSSPNPEMYAGLTLTPFMAGSMSNVKTYKTSFWTAQNADKILVIRRGTDWSDTPYVWAPYVDYVSNPLTLPDTFSQRQGVMSRSAHKVVVGDAMASVQISTGVTGSQVA